MERCKFDAEIVVSEAKQIQTEYKEKMSEADSILSDAKQKRLEASSYIEAEVEKRIKDKEIYYKGKTRKWVIFGIVGLIIGMFNLWNILF